MSGGESKRLRTPNLNFEREHVSRERLDPGAFGSCIAAVGAPKRIPVMKFVPAHTHIHIYTYTHILTGTQNAAKLPEFLRDRREL